MEEFIIYIFKLGICVGIFFLIYQLLLRKTTFFKFNRYFLMFGLLVSLIAPFIHYKYNVYMPISASGMEAVTIEGGQIEETKIANYIWSILFCIYLAGIIFLLIRNIRAYRHLYIIISEGTRSSYKKCKLIDNPKIKAPFSFFNYIVLNNSALPETDRTLILEHEKAHIYQKHWIDIICGECMLMLQWFNPLVWIYISLQKENHEFLADNSIIEKGISPVLYRAVLINQQFQGPVFSFSNSFNYSNQLNRLKMIKKTKSAPWKRAAALAILPLFGLFFWASATPNYVVESNETNRSVTVKDGNMDNVLVTIDGNEGTMDAIKTHQDKGKQDAFQLRTKDGNMDITPLYIVDDIEVSRAAFRSLNPDNIESISILKDKVAIETYGEKGRDGVIIVVTKNKAPLQ